MSDSIHSICQRAVLAEMDPARERPTLSSETRLADLGLDSLDLVSVVITLESELARDIGDRELEEIETFGQLVAAFERAGAGHG